MEKITYFYIDGCPYCKNADKAIAELYTENDLYKNIKIERIEENRHPEIAAKYDYYAVPCMFVKDVKKYEAHLFEPYGECKANIKKIFDEIL